MKISESVIEKINTSQVRLKLASALGVGENSVRNYINNNEENGDLTKISALQIIRDETGLTDEEILTSESKVA